MNTQNRYPRRDTTYNQKTWPMCTFTAIANAREKVKGKAIPMNELRDLFIEAGGSEDNSKRNAAMKGNEALDFFQKKSLIKGYKEVWQIYKKKHADLAEMKRCILSRDASVIFGMRLRGSSKEKWIFDKNFILQPTKKPISGFHCVEVDSYAKIKGEEGEILEIENSYGELFGTAGRFRLRMSDFETEIAVAYAVYF